MSAESIRIINSAITRQNGNTIASVDDGTKEAILFNANYETVVASELTGPAWKFARKTALLADTSSDPVDTDWKYTLQLPADLLMLRTVIKSGQPIEYEVLADTILCNDNAEVYAIYTYRVPEDAWPADFKEGIIRRLEAIFLRSESQPNEAGDMDARADKRFGDARRTHAQEESAKDPVRYDLLKARRTGSAPRRF